MSRISVLSWSSPVRSYSREASQSASRSEEHTSELQSPCNLVCRLLLEKNNAVQCGDFIKAPLPDEERHSVWVAISRRDDIYAGFMACFDDLVDRLGASTPLNVHRNTPA